MLIQAFSYKVFHFLFRTNLAERYLVENDTELESDLGDEVHDDDQDEMEEVLSNFTKKRIKKPGRKATWHESTLNDVVDIVVSSEYFRKRLIFQNTKNQKNSELYSRILKELKERAATRDEEISFTPVQLRNKFKKLVSECKKSALTIKSASGIKRFQDQKGYGAWFDKLYALVKTRDSCQPELAREPSMNQAVDEASLSSLPDDSPESDTSPPLFVPIKKTSKKKGKGSTDEVVDMLRTLVENDPLKEFLKFAKEEAEKAREHEMRLLQMLMGSQAQPQSTSYQVPTAGYQGHAGFYQSQAVYPCTPPNRQNNQQNMTYDQNVEENERLFYQNL